jgi:hypothetical protein
MPFAYPKIFKEKMLEKMLPPDAQSPYAVEADTGVCARTLYRWLGEVESDSVGDMKKRNKKKKSSAKNRTRKPSSRKRRRLSLEEKYALVLEAAEKPKEEFGEFLRANGLHESDLEEYRAEVQQALSEQKNLGRERSKNRKRVEDLEKELKRKEKALAEAAALLVLKKKVQEIWEDEDDDTNGKNDK